MAFTRFTKNVLNVSALPDRVQNQAQALKATFDQAGVDIKTALNALIAELEKNTSASNIGADVQSVATKTVQAILTAFEEAIADRYTKTEAETLLAIETNNLLADLDVNLTTGVITVTKKDGTSATFDTAIEKVPAKFEVVQNSDTYALKITNVDGTSTQADITNFMNIYNFNNSDYITFETTGTGTEKVVTANIKANSIGLDKLSLSVVSTLEGYMNSAKDSATAAKTSETNARASELNALEAKNTAVTKANEASASASAAKTSETNAEYWAKQAQAGGGGGGGITEIPVATADTLGGIKVGEGLSITEEGVLSTEGSIPDVAFEEREYGCFTINAPSETTVDTEIPISTIKANMTVNGNKLTLKKGKTYLVKISCRHVAFSGASGTLSIKLCKNDGSEVKRLCNFYPMNVSNATYGGSAEYMLTFEENTEVHLAVQVWGAINTYNDLLFTVQEIDGLMASTSANGFKVLEASTDNVIDFNTLTEPGVYLIKNCINGTTATNFTTTTSSDVILIVGKNTSGTIYQTLHGVNTYSPTHRFYTLSTNTWSVWSPNIPASFINVGTLATGMKCATPTADTELANKTYVDTQVATKADTNHSQGASTITAGTLAGKVLAQASSVATLTNSQLRNIKAQTTDLTAGTSTLTTGDIVLIYE